MAIRIDLTGKTFGRLKVLRRQGSAPNGRGTTPAWLVRCECGTEKLVLGANLRSERTTSCGCKKAPHGAYVGSENRPTPEYNAWNSMHQRCSNPKNRGFRSYGGRGIKVCARWASAAMFLADMGPRPSAKHSLDRKDVNGNYTPENCRWATRVEQARNKRNNHVLRAKGQVFTISEWSARTGLKTTTIRERIRRGWSAEDAVSLPAP